MKSEEDTKHTSVPCLTPELQLRPVTVGLGKCERRPGQLSRVSGACPMCAQLPHGFRLWHNASSCPFTPGNMK